MFDCHFIYCEHNHDRKCHAMKSAYKNCPVYKNIIEKEKENDKMFVHKGLKGLEEKPKMNNDKKNTEREEEMSKTCEVCRLKESYCESKEEYESHNCHQQAIETHRKIDEAFNKVQIEMKGTARTIHDLAERLMYQEVCNKQLLLLYDIKIKAMNAIKFAEESLLEKDEDK